MHSNICEIHSVFLGPLKFISETSVYKKEMTVTIEVKSSFHMFIMIYIFEKIQIFEKNNPGFVDKAYCNFYVIFGG